MSCEVVLKPLKLLPTAMIFISAATLLWGMTHLCIPQGAECTGCEPIIFWFICGGLGVFTPLIIAGVMMLRKEGYRLTKETFVERLRFRLMTRQEKAFGGRTWIVHGTGWAIFHIAFGWQLLVMLFPLLYIESYVVQKTQNIWTGVFLHGVINGPSFIAIALGVI